MSLSFNFIDDTNAVLSGELTRHYVAHLARQKQNSLFKKNVANIDLAQVTKVDTSGLAWLLLIVEKAQQKNLTLSFSNLPHDLVKLAKLSAVEALLPLSENTAV